MIRMMPGQEPYTDEELKELYHLVRDAAAAEVTELEEGTCDDRGE